MSASLAQAKWLFFSRPCLGTYFIKRKKKCDRSAPSSEVMTEGSLQKKLSYIMKELATYSLLA
jgi:hypothetical protein